MQSALGSGNIPSYRPLLQAETYAFLQRLIDTPENYMHHIKRFSGSQTLSIVYGYRVTTDDDPQLKRAEETLDLLGNHIASAGAGVWLVDVLPFRKHHLDSTSACSSRLTNTCSQVRTFVAARSRVQT